jgi:hypothetical protein
LGTDHGSLAELPQGCRDQRISPFKGCLRRKHFKERLINRDDGNHLLLPPHAGSVGNVKGAEHSGAFISTLDIGKAGGYPAGQPGAASELEKFFLNNATSILTDSVMKVVITVSAGM